jgi:hypothetical protein
MREGGTSEVSLAVVRVLGMQEWMQYVTVQYGQ